MSYAMAVALQTAVYQRLVADAAVSELAGSAVYDALPAGVLPQTYVTLGPEDVRDRSDRDGTGAVHRFTVSVHGDGAGFATVKGLAGAITDALSDADLILGRGRLVGLWFERATARRGSNAGNGRRIDLRFRALLEDN
jgi:uncharacterized protein DUF3168